jgi:translation initiation factor IF-2
MKVKRVDIILNRFFRRFSSTNLDEVPRSSILQSVSNGTQQPTNSSGRSGRIGRGAVSSNESVVSNEEIVPLGRATPVPAARAAVLSAWGVNPTQGGQLPSGQSSKANLASTIKGMDVARNIHGSQQQVLQRSSGNQPPLQQQQQQQRPFPSTPTTSLDFRALRRQIDMQRLKSGGRTLDGQQTGKVLNQNQPGPQKTSSSNMQSEQQQQQQQQDSSPQLQQQQQQQQPLLQRNQNQQQQQQFHHSGQRPFQRQSNQVTHQSPPRVQASLVDVRGSGFAEIIDGDPIASAPSLTLNESESVVSRGGRVRGVARHQVVASRFGVRGGPGMLRGKMSQSQKAAKGQDIARKRVVTIDESLTPRLLASYMGVNVQKVLQMLIDLGEKATASAPDGPIDADIAEVIAQDFGMKTKRVDDKKRDRVRTPIPSAEEMAKDLKKYVLRAPIITVMGHVDHGKTTLLDALRGGTKVAEGEAGGITQGVAAFSVAMRASAQPITTAWRGDGANDKILSINKEIEQDKDGGSEGSDRKKKKKKSPKDDESSGIPTSSITSENSEKKKEASPADVMTFIDTPGHALFSSMRKRGSSLTDLVVLVVDGKDGVMPQTKECVKIIVESGLPCVVAATKSDLLTDVEGACQLLGKQLLELGLATEAFGGDAPIIPLSARTGSGLNELKEALELQATMLELRADVSAQGECVVMDSRVITGMGQVCDTIVRWGMPKVGDFVVAGDEYGRIKALLTDAVAAKSLDQRIQSGSETSKTNEKKGKDKGNVSDVPFGAALALSQVESALPGTPVRVLGLKGCPAAGSDLLIVESEERARSVVAGRQRRSQAHAMLRIAAADSVKRDSERGEYKLRRQRKAAYELATQRERRRYKLRKTGQPVPEDLALQPWEAAIMQEGREGRVEGVNSRSGKRQRQQGGQQGDVSMGFRLSDLVARGEMTSSEAAAEQQQLDANASGDVSLPVGPVPVAFVLKSDSSASLIAVEDAIARIASQTTAVLPRVVTSTVGEVREKDLEYAETMNAHILAFNTRVPNAVQKIADRKKLKIRSAKVIYHLLDEVCELLGEHLPIEMEEEVVAVADVKAVFSLNANRKSDPEKVAGCVIGEGTFSRGLPKYRLVRDGKVVFEGKALGSLQQFKEKVDSVNKGKECGVSIEGWNEYIIGDKIECVKSREKKRKLHVKFD